jgi:hypothetical protein
MSSTFGPPGIALRLETSRRDFGDNATQRQVRFAFT